MNSQLDRGAGHRSRFVRKLRYPRPNCRLALQPRIQADLTREVPAAEQDHYHAITDNGILHHLHHPLDTVLRALHRSLRPGDRLIFWKPNLRNPYVWTIFTWAPLRRAAKLEPDEMAFTPRLHPQQTRRAGAPQNNWSPHATFCCPTPPIP